MKGEISDRHLNFIGPETCEPIWDDIFNFIGPAPCAVLSQYSHYYTCEAGGSAPELKTRPMSPNERKMLIKGIGQNKCPWARQLLTSMLTPVAKQDRMTVYDGYLVDQDGNPAWAISCFLLGVHDDPGATTVLWHGLFVKSNLDFGPGHTVEGHVRMVPAHEAGHIHTGSVSQDIADAIMHQCADETP